MKISNLAYVLSLAATSALADNSTLDAAIGGGLGGATGAAIGNEVAGREGAIIGGAVGGGIGAALTTEERFEYYIPEDEPGYRAEPQYIQPASRFCPPGQAKKGRC